MALLSCRLCVRTLENACPPHLPLICGKPLSFIQTNASGAYFYWAVPPDFRGY